MKKFLKNLKSQHIAILYNYNILIIKLNSLKIININF